MTNGRVCRNDRRGCFVSGGHQIQHAADHGGGDEGADSVVDGGDNPVGHFFQCRLNGVEAGHASLYHSLGEGNCMLYAHLSPSQNMLSREHNDYVRGGLRFKETFYGALKDREAAKVQELLGNGAPHAGAAAARHENGIYFP